MSIFAAIALVLGGVVLAHGADSAAPRTKVVTNIDQGRAVIDGTGAVLGRTLGFGAAVQPQFNISAIVCPILDALANAFGALIGNILASLRVIFGCASQ